MRKYFMGIALVIMLALVGCAGSPSAPGPVNYGLKSTSPLFFIQNTVEQITLALKPSPDARAQFSFILLSRRASELTPASTPAAQQLALTALDQAINRSLKALAKLNPNQIPPLNQIAQIAIQNAQTALAGSTLPSSQALQMVEFKLQRFATFMRSGPPTSEQLVELAGKKLTDDVPTPAPTPMVNFEVVHPSFALVSAHANLACSACHAEGKYQKMPTDCASCHSAQAPSSHYPLVCESCHQPTTWKDVRFDHATVVDSSQCATCHSKVRPSSTHYTPQCGLCHSTIAWKPAQFDHSVAAAADCITCHQTQRPANHWSAQCSACHKSTTAWLPASFDHKVAGATDCISCHASRKPAGHWNAQCSGCHGTGGWLPASFNHSAAGATDCISCHASRKPAGHWNAQCSGCHGTGGWRPASFNHSAAGATDCVSCHGGQRPAGHNSGQCSSCHSTSTWAGARVNHTFDINHGGANGKCSVCHPNGPPATDCKTCHAKNGGGGD